MEEIKVDTNEFAEDAAVALSAPWVTYFKMVYNVLMGDPEISMPKTIEDEGEGVYSFYIESPNATKIIALSKVLKNELEMGNITVKIQYRCTDDAYIELLNEEITVKDYEDAFTGNKYFVEVVQEPAPVGTFDYAVFSRDIITFFNDDMTDYHANAHYIVADIIKQITDPSHVCPCTYFGAEDAGDDDVNVEA